jgi:hypothetical protein
VKLLLNGRVILLIRRVKPGTFELDTETAIDFTHRFMTETAFNIVWFIDLQLLFVAKVGLASIVGAFEFIDRHYLATPCIV